MPGWPNLKNAPITEALIDIRVLLAEGIQQANLETVHERIKAQYPTRRQRQSFEASFEFRQNEDPVPNISKGKDGYLLISEDEKQVLQTRLDGFTFSRLKPYQSWIELRDEARRLWEIYSSITKPQKLTRLAVRYIDLIELPLPFSDFHEWILTVPEVAPTLPQALAAFLTRMVIPFDDTGTTAIITQNFGPQPGQNHRNTVSLIFDIDVFRSVDIAGNSNELWMHFEELREVKNRIFFESITRKTEALFK